MSNVVALDHCASFGNNNGQLVCEDMKGGERDLKDSSTTEGMRANAENVPPGSYLESCTQCQVFEDEEEGHKVLSCMACGNWHGATYASTLRLDSCPQTGNGANNIGNENGKLVCEGIALPKGTYQDSCRDCSVTTNQRMVLTCNCKDGSGTPNGTVLYPPEIMKDGEPVGFEVCQNIENQNGQLVCVRGERQEEESGKEEDDTPPKEEEEEEETGSENGDHEPVRKDEL